jgi:hypothetical protein
MLKDGGANGNSILVNADLHEEASHARTVPATAVIFGRRLFDSAEL